MTAPNITINGGTTVRGGVAVQAARGVMRFVYSQIVDAAGPDIVTANGFIQPPEANGSPVIIIQLTQSQQDYITANATGATSYALFTSSWGDGSTDTRPNTAFVLLPTSSWEYALLIPLGSLDFNNFNTYNGTWNFPATALTLVDWA